MNITKRFKGSVICKVPQELLTKAKIDLSKEVSLSILEENIAHEIDRDGFTWHIIPKGTLNSGFAEKDKIFSAIIDLSIFDFGYEFLLNFHLLGGGCKTIPIISHGVVSSKLNKEAEDRIEAFDEVYKVETCNLVKFIYNRGRFLVDEKEMSIFDLYPLFNANGNFPITFEPVENASNGN